MENVGMHLNHGWLEKAFRNHYQDSISEDKWNFASNKLQKLTH